MCNINRDAEMALLAMGINLIGQAIEASLKENSSNPSTDVIAAATQAYQQGKITKNQFIAVINALDEQVYRSRAYKPNHPNNRAYLETAAYLN